MLRSVLPIAVSGVLTATGAAAGAARADVVVNEVLGNTDGDDAEYIELYNRGGDAVDIGGWGVTLYDGDAGGGFGATDGSSPYTVSPGTVLAPGEFFLFANDTAQSVFAVRANASLPANAIENSSYTLVLSDADGAVLQSYFLTDGGEGDAANVAGEPITADRGFGPDGRFVPPGFTRTADGADAFAVLPFGVPEPMQTPTAGTGGDDPMPATVTIMAIQGAGHVSPLLDESVTTEGVVTAIDSNGFYLQDPAGDGIDATSDALLVFTGAAPAVAVGDVLRLSGRVGEFTPGGSGSGNLSTTQLGNVTIDRIGSAALPAPVIMGLAGRPAPDRHIDDDAFARFDPDSDGIDYFESLEGMRVRVPMPLVIAPTNRFGELFTVADHGATASGLSERGTLNIAPDDFNPEKIQIDVDDGILADFELPSLAVGAVLEDVTGVLGYGFGNYEVYPTVPFGTASAASLHPETGHVATGDGRLTLATYNVLNLDPNDDDGDTDVADGRFEAIAGHIVSNLGAPAIVALQEIQDGNGSVDDELVSAAATLQTLADAVSAAGGPAYRSIDTEGLVPVSVGGQPGGNIRVAFLYDPARVSLAGEAMPLVDPQDQAVNVINPFFGSRIPLVANFKLGERTLTVINAHLSSKGGSAPILGTEQPFEALQEDIDVNGSLDERRLQAAAIDAFVAERLAADPTAAIIVLGDLNEFEFVSPVQDLLGANLVNTTEAIDERERYSFIFQGNSQQIDHVLVSEALAASAEVDAVHVNVEFPGTGGRASDHDPVLASVDLTPAAPVTPAGLADLDGNGRVDRHDLIAFIRAYGTHAGERNYLEAADLNRDDRVSLDDLQAFFVAYFESLVSVAGWRSGR